MKRLVLIVTVALGWPGAAGAQVVDGWGWSVIIPSVAQTDILGTHLRDLRARDEARGAAPSEAAPDLAALRYTPSLARRKANLAGFVAASRKADPAAAASLEAFFAEQGDLIEKLNGIMATQGLQADNVADAYAVWWMSAWQASRGSIAETDVATNRAVQGQVARALASTAELARAGDAAKQQLAEALLVQTVMLEAAVEQARGDPAQLRAVAAAATQGARGMGLDLSTMNLTPAGFVPAK